VIAESGQDGKHKMAKILIVDDDAGTLDVLRGYLDRSGHELVAAATSGEEAIPLAETHRPDLVLMDIALPGGMDGIDTAFALKEISDTPIIFTTGRIAQEFEDRLEGIGHYGFLTKPFGPQELASAIEEVLR